MLQINNIYRLSSHAVKHKMNSCSFISNNAKRVFKGRAGRWKIACISVGHWFCVNLVKDGGIFFIYLNFNYYTEFYKYNFLREKIIKVHFYFFKHKFSKTLTWIHHKSNNLTLIGLMGMVGIKSYSSLFTLLQKHRLQRNV